MDYFPQLVVGFVMIRSSLEKVEGFYWLAVLNEPSALPKLIGLLINSDDSFISCLGAETPQPAGFQQTPTTPNSPALPSLWTAEGGALSEGGRPAFGLQPSGQRQLAW